MSITVEVSLLSGKTAAVEADLYEAVQAVAQRAQIALGVGKGRLLDSSGAVLDGCACIKKAKVQNGDSLTLHVNRVQVQSSDGAFAAILGDGSVVTWGEAECGADSSAVQTQLKNVQEIQASERAFAAILGDGSVVTWGDAAFGGDSRAVQGQLTNVQQIQASLRAFAAILGDRTVVTWGHADFGGDSSAVQGQLNNVQQILACSFAFAARLGDGSVVTWGDAAFGGDSRAVQVQLRNVQQIQASDGAFAAILDDGSVVTWGNPAFGGDSRAVQGQLTNVQQIQASLRAFAAILGEGTVVTWGDAEHGGDSSAVQGQLQNVQQIQASERAFAAILGDGSVVTWGDRTRFEDMQFRSADHVEFKKERERLGLPSIGEQSLHMSFLGNPGTGKADGDLLQTLAAMEMQSQDQHNVAMGAIESSREGSLVTEVSRADLVGQHLGRKWPFHPNSRFVTMNVLFREYPQGEIPDTVLCRSSDDEYQPMPGRPRKHRMELGAAFDEAFVRVFEVRIYNRKAKGGVLFLDEAYALVNPSTEDMFGHEAVDTLIKLMEDHRDKVVVILAGYQSEMVEFIAANPGFRSRIAFEFNFRDYTCPELVQIGETLMKSKNVALLPDKSIGVCASGAAKDVCDWMAASIRFRTGCCDTEDCGKEENRANGNGRTVRNMLEASYREMGSRVLTTYPPLLLTEYETGDADLRCAFRLLDAGDLRRSTALALSEQLQANCQRTRTPITVNVSSIFGEPGAVEFGEGDLRRSTALALSEQLQANCQRTRTPITVNVSSIFGEPGAVDRLDWSKLHDLIFGEHACSKAQAVLNGDTSAARSLLEGGGDWGWGSPGGLRA
ncbi:Protein CfxQ [Symbiodinium microadriaticum]|uniref:Protein CfxQ n=1 Tax=Symbiodinium microadriaticum TaxID=2951 RepID=A0A1Q9D0X7_SYMMI|nr:Protein CfxQ [Symbiodinium microadriaticum]